MINLGIQLDIRNLNSYFHIQEAFLDNRKWLSLGLSEVEMVGARGGSIDIIQAIQLRNFLNTAIEEYEKCQSQETTAIPKPSETHRIDESPK